MLSMPMPPNLPSIARVRPWRRALCGLVGLLTALGAVAQGLPGAAQPGAIERDRRDVPAPRAAPGRIDLPAPIERVPEGAADITFTLRALAIDGATVYTNDALIEPHRSRLGREATLADLFAIARSITTRYRNDGYVLSQAIVPAQTITDGHARIVVVEGFIHEVRLTGEMGGNRTLIEAYAGHLRAVRPLHARTLERYLLLMNDLAGATARSTLLPAESVAGGADLVIEFTHRTVTGSVSTDNRGGRTLGPWRVNADIDVNSLFGRHDRTAIRTSSSLDRRLNFGSVQHEQPVGSDGARVGVLLGYAEARPRVDMNGTHAVFETSSASGAVSYTQPLVRSRTLNLHARAALGAHDSETRFEGASLRHDRVRMVRLGATLDIADAWKGVNILDLELSHGLDALGARETGAPDLSREQGRSDFTKFTLYAARLQSLAPRWSLLAAMNGQYAANPLLASELAGFGGGQFGRGFDPSELLGDSALAGKLELRYTDHVPASLRLAWTTYGFWDAGRVWRRVPINEAASESAAAFGLGIKVDVGRSVSGFGELAKPATRDVRADGNRDPRLYVGLAWRFD